MKVEYTIETHYRKENGIVTSEPCVASNLVFNEGDYKTSVIDFAHVLHKCPHCEMPNVRVTFKGKTQKPVLAY